MGDQSAMKSTTSFARSAALLALAAVLLLVQPASGQGFKWWQSDEFKKELGLTAEQTRRLEEIFQKALPGLKVQKTALDVAEAQFEKLIERGGDAAMEQINAVEAARFELNKTRQRMLVNMRNLLTGEQWAKFTALHQAAEKAQKSETSSARPAGK
jgi:Spy/CpxP family protein refolding chaperone